jgi:ribosomal protein S18 acetylase RimI-like enzyme
MTFAVRRARESDLEDLVAVAVVSQADPDRFSAYLGDDPDSIRADVVEVENWPAFTHVALDDSRNVIGWLLADTDDEMGRVWWWGPFFADAARDQWAVVADALLGAGMRELADFTEHELAFDKRSSIGPLFTERHGFIAEEGSVALRASALDVAAPTIDPSVGLVISDVDVATAEPVAVLHDEIFPGTHTVGRALVDAADDEHLRLVAVADGRVVGYVATELQNDGSLYIDFLGVTDRLRGRGVGRALIAAAMRRHVGRADTAHLTVREHNAAAQALYASLGFVAELVFIPFRRGFSVS